MTVKLNSLARWASLDNDKAIVFDHIDDVDTERRVRIQFNLEGVTSFFVHDGQEKFLCTIGPGQETVEFNTAGAFKVYAENGSGAVQYWSMDLEPNHVEVVDPVIYTQIATRRTRNPELEEMMFRMNQNLERRLAAQADEIEAQYQRRMAEMEHVKQVADQGAAISAGGETQPQPGAGSGEPVQPAAPAAPSEPAGAGTPNPAGTPQPA